MSCCAKNLPTTKERVAMAAGWPIAMAIPDRVYSLLGKWILEFWERDVLKRSRVVYLANLIRRISSLGAAGAIPRDCAAEIAHAWFEFVIQRFEQTPESHDDVTQWYAEGYKLDVWDLFDPSADIGDPFHRPTPQRNVCLGCGGVQ